MYTRTNLSLKNHKLLLLLKTKPYARKKTPTTDMTAPGRFDGINFNYQIMTIFDLIRVMYISKYIENVQQSLIINLIMNKKQKTRNFY